MGAFLSWLPIFRGLAAMFRGRPLGARVGSPSASSFWRRIRFSVFSFWLGRHRPLFIYVHLRHHLRHLLFISAVPSPTGYGRKSPGALAPHAGCMHARIYGFYNEVKRRFRLKTWRVFCDCFDCLPLAAVVGGRIFCCHGGLSPELRRPADVERIQRPLAVPDEGLLCDLLWADPEDIEGWGDGRVSYGFGPDVVRQFLVRNDLDLVVRAHQVVPHGYEFFAGRQLVTLFSAPNYCGEFDNAGAVLTVQPDLECSFAVLWPQ